MNETKFFELLLYTHFFTTCYMIGLIWFVQVVHYPLLKTVGRKSFSEYEKKHMERTSLVVGPPMIFEAATALNLLAMAPAFLPTSLLWLNLFLLSLIWASTLLVQMPIHNALLNGFDSALHYKLVRTNWHRTFLWMIRGGLLTYILWCLLYLR